MRTADGKARWIMLAMLFVCRTALGLQFQTVGSVGNALHAAFGFSHARIGTLIGLFMLPGALVAMPSGYAGRYFSDRVLVGVGLIALGAGGFAATAAHSFGWLAAGRILSGTGFVISTLYFTKMTQDWFAGKELATAMGVLVMSWPFGIAIGQLGFPALVAIHGWNAVFDASAAYCVAAAVLVLLVYRPPAQHAELPLDTPLGLPRNELALTLIASLVWALFNGSYVVYLSFAPQLLVSTGYAPVPASAVVSITSWTLIFSGALWGYIADRTRKRDQVLYACTAIAVGSLALLQHGSQATLLCFMLGFMGFAPAGIIMALTGESMSTQRRAFGMGVFLTANYLLFAPAPAIAGWLYDRSGNASHAVLFAGLLFAAAALFNFVFRLMQRRLPALAG